MRRVITGFAVLAILFVSALMINRSCERRPSTGDASADAFIEWAAKNASVLDTTDSPAGIEDLQPLRGIVGDAYFVCLGESRHDVSEFFQVKHRIFRFLVEEMGFTVFLLEAGLPYCRSINQYIQGGEGDPEALLSGMGYWALWDTKEMLNLVKWMREYNLDPAHDPKLSFYGIDIMYPRSGIQFALEYLETVDPDYARTVADQPFGLEVFDDTSWIRTSNILRFSEEQDIYNLKNNLSLLLKRFEDRQAEYIGQTGDLDYLWAARCVQIAERAIETFEKLIAGSHARAGELRDTAMASNVIWLHTNIFPDERAMVWAHNGHITRTEFEMPDVTDRPVTNMGKHLTTRFEDHLVSVALVFGSGEYPGEKNRDPQIFPRTGPQYLDGVLDRTGIRRFILDLRPAPANGLVAGWMDREARLRAQDGDMVLVTRGAYDAVLFVDRATPTFRNSKTIERLGGVRPDR
jgi:erythromycin esterase